eukprot:12968661-Heterocapsa_arctica.AAC.1
MRPWILKSRQRQQTTSRLCNFVALGFGRRIEESALPRKPMCFMRGPRAYYGAKAPCPCQPLPRRADAP